jgi:hypothetical protein
LLGSTVSTWKPRCHECFHRELQGKLTRDVLITSEGSDNSGLVGKDDLVVRGRREETLQNGDGGIEHDGALNASLDSDFDLGVVDKVSTDSIDVRGRLAVEVGLTDQAAKAVGLNLIHVSFLYIKVDWINPTSPRAVVSVFDPE